MNNYESDHWTFNKRKELLSEKFMLSRSIFKDKFFLRVVFGNYNTSKSHIIYLLKLLNTV